MIELNICAAQGPQARTLYTAAIQTLSAFSVNGRVILTTPESSAAPALEINGDPVPWDGQPETISPLLRTWAAEQLRRPTA